MGFAFPGAIAAHLVHPDRRILAVCGDGGFLMNVQEMETARRLDSKITVMVWEDGGYGLIAWKQDTQFGSHTNLAFGNPDWVKLAERPLAGMGIGWKIAASYGCPGERLRGEGPEPRGDSDRLPREPDADRTARGHRLSDLAKPSPTREGSHAERNLSLLPGQRGEQTNTDLEVTDKYTGEVATRVAMADAEAIDRAIGAAEEATAPMRELRAYQRQEVLDHCVGRFQERYEDAQALCIEAGKPIKDARGEVTRLIDTFRIAAEESIRLPGEVLPMDISPRAQDYTGQWKRVPIGPCSFIAPTTSP